jgi:hypothetical protein
MKNTKTSFALSVITLTLLLTACSGANSGSSSPEANNGASTTNTSASTGSPIPSLPVTPGSELPTPTPTPTPTPSPATPSQPVNPAAAAIAALEANGTIPKLDRSDSLTGPDLDGNGVRDDVDAWIKSKLTDPKQIAAAMQSAKAMQKAILVDLTNKVATRAVMALNDRATYCMLSVFPASANAAGYDFDSKIESLTTNTKPRLRAYLAYNKALDGTTSSAPTSSTCD